MALTTLAHHIDVSFLEEVYRRTRKSGSPGIDGQTSTEHGADLASNLAELLPRFKAGFYRVPAVKRVFIPKMDGARPLGRPT